MSRLSEVVKGIAEHLGFANPNLLVEPSIPNDAYATIQIVIIDPETHDPDCRLNFYLDQSTQRVTVTGNKPTSRDGKSFLTADDTWVSPTTLSITRKPDALAKDIDRKVLAPYLEIFPDAALQRDKDNAKSETHHQIGQEFAALVGGKLGDNRITSGGPGIENGGTVRQIIVSESTVELHLRHVPHDVAIAMLKLWMNHSPNKVDMDVLREFSNETGLSLFQAKRLVILAADAIHCNRVGDKEALSIAFAKMRTFTIACGYELTVSPNTPEQFTIYTQAGPAFLIPTTGE